MPFLLLGPQREKNQGRRFLPGIKSTKSGHTFLTNINHSLKRKHIALNNYNVKHKCKLAIFCILGYIILNGKISAMNNVHSESKKSFDPLTMQIYMICKFFTGLPEILFFPYTNIFREFTVNFG